MINKHPVIGSSVGENTSLMTEATLFENCTGTAVVKHHAEGPSEFRLLGQNRT